MNYYKLLDDNGSIIRLDYAETNVSNGIQITEEEYRQYIPEPSDDIIDDEEEELE